MAEGYSRSPKLLKGALVEFSERFIGPIPNIIIFQYNPENISRELEVYTPRAESDADQNPATSGDTAANAQPADPPESFNLTLELDATDDLEANDPIAVVTGVADRLAALEMLLYPQEGSLLGDLLGALNVSVSVGAGGLSAGAGGSAAAEAVPRGAVPIVLLVWGPGRIVPVRLKSFTVDEQAFSPLLYPIQAKVTVGLKIVTEADLAGYEDSLAKDIAIAAFKFTRTQKRVLAAANIANTVDSILGMLPF
jgi:hypothetical protein